MCLLGTIVWSVDCIRDLGVLVDIHITLTNHVNKVAGLCFFYLCQLRIIRRALTNDMAHSERSSTTGSTTVCWLSRWNTSSPNYSWSFMLRPVYLLTYCIPVSSLPGRSNFWSALSLSLSRSLSLSTRSLSLSLSFSLFLALSLSLSLALSLSLVCQLSHAIRSTTAPNSLFLWKYFTILAILSLPYHSRACVELQYC